MNSINFTMPDAAVFKKCMKETGEEWYLTAKEDIKRNINIEPKTPMSFCPLIFQLVINIKFFPTVEPTMSRASAKPRPRKKEKESFARRLSHLTRISYFCSYFVHISHSISFWLIGFEIIQKVQKYRLSDARAIKELLLSMQQTVKRNCTRAAYYRTNWHNKYFSRNGKWHCTTYQGIWINCAWKWWPTFLIPQTALLSFAFSQRSKPHTAPTKPAMAMSR